MFFFCNYLPEIAPRLYCNLDKTGTRLRTLAPFHFCIIFHQLTRPQEPRSWLLGTLISSSQLSQQDVDTLTLAVSNTHHPLSITALRDVRWARNVNFTREEHGYHQRQLIDVSALIIGRSPSVNTHVWANGRTPPEKWACWWAMSPIFTSQLRDGVTGSLVLRHISCLLSLSVPFPPLTRLLVLLREANAPRYKRMKRKQNAVGSSGLVLRLCQRALPLITRAKVGHGISKPKYSGPLTLRLVMH